MNLTPSEINPGNVGLHQEAAPSEEFSGGDTIELTEHALSVASLIGGTELSQSQKEDDPTTRNTIESYKPRYDLTKEELDELNIEIVAAAKEKFPAEGVVGVWINPQSKYANFIRMHEASYFPEVSEVSAEDEEQTLFLALVDTRTDANRVVHGATITGISYDAEKEQLKIRPEIDDETTGMYTIDSLIELGNFSSEEFQDYYKNKGIDPTKCFAVETNFRIGDKAEQYLGIGTADMAYLMIFNIFERANIDLGSGAVFATINRASKISFDRVGLNYEPLMGREDLVTEEAELGVESTPVALFYDNNSAELLRSINALLPEMHLT